MPKPSVTVLELNRGARAFLCAVANPLRNICTPEAAELRGKQLILKTGPRKDNAFDISLVAVAKL